MGNDLPESSEQPLSPHSPNIEDSFGHPVRVPRVGDQYQAQIPPLVIDCCCEESDLRIISKFRDEFSLGLPVPISWVGSHDENKESGSENISRSPLPILPSKPWKAIEHDSFVAGLYIFGKNLKNVKRFVKSKRMGEILVYYYGKFYRSSTYHRWSKEKKLKRKGCIRGEKIFAGWRREELLSRLFLRASEESRSLLREIDTKYENNEVSIEKYVFFLRRMVGIKAVIEAIAIGKGKRDLTRKTSDPKKIQDLPPCIPKIPKGKAFSSLNPQEIIQLLNHLSKARLKDLFWDAVWPCLLANGWHSEQPKGYSILNSKRSIVFIIPGVEKFSRRELVKGRHYFDSVTDVLDKVALDPLLLEGKAGEEMANKENEKDLEIIQKPDNLPRRKACSYLRPPLLNRNMANFTIVDTSLRYGGERSKVVEMRTLPEEAAADISMLSQFRGEAVEKSSGVDIYKSEALDHSPKLTGIRNNRADLDPIGGNSSLDGKLIGDESPCDNSPDTYENKESQVGPSKNLSSDCSLARESPDIYEDDVDCNGRKSRALIDLNLPPLPRELESNGTSSENMAHDHGESGILLTDTSSKVAPLQASEQCSDVLNGRRQSTRSRPLTAKVLEAIAYGFLSPTRKRKNVETSDDHMSSGSRRLARDKVAKCSTMSGSNADNNTS